MAKHKAKKSAAQTPTHITNCHFQQHAAPLSDKASQSVEVLATAARVNAEAIKEIAMLMRASGGTFGPMIVIGKEDR